MSEQMQSQLTWRTIAMFLAGLLVPLVGIAVASAFNTISIDDVNKQITISMQVERYQLAEIKHQLNEIEKTLKEMQSK